jgi:hypothetical protein
MYGSSPRRIPTDHKHVRIESEEAAQCNANTMSAFSRHTSSIGNKDDRGEKGGRSARPKAGQVALAGRLTLVREPGGSS